MRSNFRLNLFLLRYWNLYDSCYYSNHVISQLSTWGDNGVNDLEQFLIQIGIPLTEAKQKYSFMQVGRV